MVIVDDEHTGKENETPRDYSSRKTIDYDLQDKVIELHYTGKSNREIADALNMTDTQVGYFINWFKRKVPEWVSKLDAEWAKSYLDKFYNTYDLLYQQIEQIIKKINESDEWKEDVEYRKIFVKLTELLAKIRGEIKNAIVTVNDNRTFNVNEMTIAIKNEMIRFVEESGELNKEEDAVIIRKPELVDIIKKKKKLANYS